MVYVRRNRFWYGRELLVADCMYDGACGIPICAPTFMPDGIPPVARGIWNVGCAVLGADPYIASPPNVLPMLPTAPLHAFPDHMIPDARASPCPIAALPIAP